MPRRLKPGSGPRFTVTVEVHCPGVACNMNCGGSANGAEKFQAALSPQASDEDRARARSRLMFCLFHCPLAPDGPRVTIRSLKPLFLPKGPGGESEPNQPMEGETNR